MSVLVYDSVSEHLPIEGRVGVWNWEPPAERKTFKVPSPLNGWRNLNPPQPQFPLPFNGIGNATETSLSS